MILGLLLVLRPYLRPAAERAGTPLRVGYGEDIPYHFKGPDGEPAGLAVDLVREAAKRRGIPLQWVQSKASGIVPLQNGECDLWVMLTIRPERLGILHFTAPYLETATSFLVLDDGKQNTLDALRNARVSLIDLEIHRINLKALLPQATAIPVATTREAILAVQQGRADGAYLDQFTATAALLSGVGGKPMRLLSSNLPHASLALASSFDYEPFADAIREEMRSFPTDGTLSRIVQKWGLPTSLSTDAILNFERDRMQNRILWGGVLGLVVALLVVVLLANRLRHQRNAAKAQEMLIRLSEERWQLALRGSNDGIWDANLATSQTFYSDRCREMLGYSSQEIPNDSKVWTELIHPEDRASVLHPP